MPWRMNFGQITIRLAEHRPAVFYPLSHIISQVIFWRESGGTIALFSINRRLAIHCKYYLCDRFEYVM